jgi:hypothetical protein
MVTRLCIFFAHSLPKDTVRAELVEARLPIDRACPELGEGLRANGFGF